MRASVSRLTPLVLAGAIVATATVATPAGAVGTGDAWANPGGEIGAGAGLAEQTGGLSGGGGEGGGAPTCAYVALDEAQSRSADILDAGWAGRRPDGPGVWFRRTCPDGRTTTIWIPAAEAVDPAVLAEEARSRTTVPLPGMNLNPGADQDQVVNLETWLWVDSWAPVSATATAGPVTVTVTATPVRVEWSMGNGDAVVCDGPGTPYDPSRSPNAQATDCSYTYRSSSAGAPGSRFTITATSVWGVTWSATGVTAGGDFGLLRRTNSVAVRVSEIQAVHQ